MLLLLPALFLLTAVGLAAPDEAVPSHELVNGSGEYVFQSVREAVLVPLGAAMTALFLLAAAFVCGTRPAGQEGSPQEARPGFEENPTASEREGQGPPARRITGRVLLLLCLGALALLVAGMGMVDPMFRFRRATVFADRVELRSLLLTWTLPRGQVDRVRMLQEVSGRGPETRYRLCLELVTLSGGRYHSVGRRLGELDSALVKWRGVMRRFVQDLRKPPPPPGSVVEEFH